MREEKGLECLCEIKLIGFADSLEVANMGQKSKVIIMACGPPFLPWKLLEVGGV